MLFINIEELKLYAHGESNWNLYQDKNGYLFAIAKPGSGAQNSCFGSVDYLKKLTRNGIKHGYVLVKVGPAT